MGTQSSHDPNPRYADRLKRERASLEALTMRYEQAIDLTPVGTGGYVARMEVSAAYQQPKGSLVATAPVIAVDADDSILAYNKARQPRLEAFAQFAKGELGYELDHEVLRAVMDMSDEFSRWKDWDIDAVLYHLDAHMWALEWATLELRGVPADGIPSKVAELQDKLNRIKAGLGNETPDPALPFSFARDELVLGTFVPSSNIAPVFEPMHDPELYDDALSVVQDLAEAGGRAVIFTYGEPLFQLHKVFRLRQRLLAGGRDWPYEYIFLSKKRKGAFVRDIFAFVSHDDELMRALFSKEPHVFMLIDDDKKEADDFLHARHEIERLSGARLCAVHALREGAKTWKKRDEVFRDHPAGRIVHETARRGVYLHGVTEDLHPHLPEGAKQARRDAYANLELRVYEVLAKNLQALVDVATEPEVKSALQAQQQRAADRVSNIARVIEETHGVRP